MLEGLGIAESAIEPGRRNKGNIKTEIFANEPSSLRIGSITKEENPIKKEQQAWKCMWNEWTTECLGEKERRRKADHAQNVRARDTPQKQ